MGSYAKGLKRRQQILDRAIEVFAQRGAEGTSMRSIGDAIGVSHAALKHYFDSRESLLIEVYRTAEARSRSAAGPPDDATVVGLMRDAARRNHAVPGLVQLYSTLVANALEDGHEEARSFFGNRFAELRRFLAERVAAEQAAGRIRSDMAPEAVAALVVAASDGLQVQWLLDADVDIEASLSLLERLLEP
jgi:TetR/AcrR family transcriptional regulator, transcriptional repressor of aconitase